MLSSPLVYFDIPARTGAGHRKPAAEQYVPQPIFMWI